MYNQKGFTLIEMAIVTLIMGIMIAAMANMYNLYIQEKRITQTHDSVDTAYEALDKYVAANGFLPCPADPADSSGIATDCTKSATGGIKQVTMSGFKVRIGAFPLIDSDKDTRLIPASKGVDGWKNKLLYAVVVNKAKDKETYSSAKGVIKILDSDGKTLTSKAAAVVLSHGANKGGAYTLNGEYLGNCSSSTIYGDIDKENCDDDAVFTETADRGYKDDDIMEYFMEASQEESAGGSITGSMYFSASGAGYSDSDLFVDISEMSDSEKKNIINAYKKNGGKSCKNSWGMDCYANYNGSDIEPITKTTSSGMFSKAEVIAPASVIDCDNGTVVKTFESVTLASQYDSEECDANGCGDESDTTTIVTKSTYDTNATLSCVSE